MQSESPIDIHKAITYNQDRSRNKYGTAQWIWPWMESPPWNHVAIAGNIYRLLGNYLEGKKCTAIPDGFDLHLTKDNILFPEVMVVCDRKKIRGNGVLGAPDLVVEVLSPSTANHDRGYKKEVYAKCGVREYWIVSPYEKSIEVYRNSGRECALHHVYSIYPDRMLEQMSDEERANVQTHFKCSLFDDLEISLDKIFNDLL